MKTAYITFHIHNYGIGFTKNILGAFYTGHLSFENLKTNYLEQKKLEEAFRNDKCDNKIVFDKVFYLHVNQATVNKITSTRRMKKSDCLGRIKDDEDMKDFFTHWKEILNESNFNENSNELEHELLKIDNKFPNEKKDLLDQYWKIIHYYNIEDQFTWFFQHANSRSIYSKENVECVNLEQKYNLIDLHDHRQICQAMASFLKEYHLNEEFDRIIINISSVGYEIQVGWFALAQAGILNDKVKFISTYDNKDQEIRFKDFIIKEIPKSILKDISDEIVVNEPDVVSDKRKLAEREFKNYFGKGFSILILGERGSGKTRLIQDNTTVSKEKFLSISAAAFDDDTKLEAELFGYKKGAFTGANQNQEGLFHKVDGGGILFIDELHAMSKRVQEKLMSSLSTDSLGNFLFKRLGGTEMEESKFTIVFASNKTIDELKYQFLLPDFFDRVVQYTISIPPLRDAREDIESDWKKTWTHQKFNTTVKCPQNEPLIDWLRTLDFPGNWRDLQRIAIWYEAFLTFTVEDRQLLGFDNPLDYVQHKYETICLRTIDNLNEFEFEFSDELTANGQVDNYKMQLALWAKNMHSSFKKAKDHFVELGDEITEKTLYNWANPEKTKKKHLPKE
ncbi:MAG TPA: sigma 54-interacting transcriptional regulator [Bacteroidales bacterium]|nr:sigma 54-interacting transcriptional regulator [Bacteroidales bacterium]